MATAIAFALGLHLLGTVILVGGMFFAHMALRPVLTEMLQPPQRLPVMHRVLERFFSWVWIAILAILASGYWLFLGVYQGKMGLHVHLMQGTGLLMVILFLIIYFSPFRRMGQALAASDYAKAGEQLVVIRRIVATNLVLGLITATLGTAGKFV